jgi:hypothetical protein
MAREFLETGEMQVFRTDAAELLEIKGNYIHEYSRFSLAFVSVLIYN